MRLKGKLIFIAFVMSVLLCLAGCSNDKKSEKKTKEKKTDYAKIMAAYKDFYKDFYEKNCKAYKSNAKEGYEAWGDCAGKIVLNEDNYPIMVISDMTGVNDSKRLCIDLYFFIYKDDEVVQYSKIPNVYLSSKQLFVDNIEGTIYVCTETGDRDADIAYMLFRVKEGDYEKLDDSRYWSYTSSYMAFDLSEDFGTVFYPVTSDFNDSIYVYKKADNLKEYVAGSDFEDVLEYFKTHPVSNVLELKQTYDDCLVKNRIKRTASTIYYEDGIFYAVMRSENLLDNLCDLYYAVYEDKVNTKNVDLIKEITGVNENDKCSVGDLWICNDAMVGRYSRSCRIDDEWYRYESHPGISERVINNLTWMIDDSQNGWEENVKRYLVDKTSLYGRKILNAEYFNKQLNAAINKE